MAYESFRLVCFVRDMVVRSMCAFAESQIENDGAQLTLYLSWHVFDLSDLQKECSVFDSIENG